MDEAEAEGVPPAPVDVAGEEVLSRDVNDGKLPKPIKVRGCVLFDWLAIAAALTAARDRSAGVLLAATAGDGGWMPGNAEP